MKHRTKHEAEKADAGMTLGAAAMPLVKIHAEQKAGARRDYMTLETGVALDTWVPVASDDVAGLTKAHAALQSLVDTLAKASFNGATGKRNTPLSRLNVLRAVFLVQREFVAIIHLDHDFVLGDTNLTKTIDTLSTWYLSCFHKISFSVIG